MNIAAQRLSQTARHLPQQLPALSRSFSSTPSPMEVKKLGVIGAGQMVSAGLVHILLFIADECRVLVSRSWQHKKPICP